MLQNLQDSQLARVLLYFINYHIYDYKTSETTPKQLKDHSSTLMAQLPLTTDRKKASWEYDKRPYIWVLIDQKEPG
jgi:hypothetical protein